MTLLEKITSKTARVGVVGLGYVGLPLAVEKARVGFSVIGFDIQKEKCDSVNRGENYIGDVVPEELVRLVHNGHLSATADFGRIAECDVVAICVPTPLDHYKQPDMSYVESSARTVAQYALDSRTHITSSPGKSRQPD
jgi:UDP-N-acetyl-D-mannosaminuronate dehydrogenase